MCSFQVKELQNVSATLQSVLSLACLAASGGGDNADLGVIKVHLRHLETSLSGDTLRWGFGLDHPYCFLGILWRRDKSG